MKAKNDITLVRPFLQDFPRSTIHNPQTYEKRTTAELVEELKKIPAHMNRLSFVFTRNKTIDMRPVPKEHICLMDVSEASTELSTVCNALPPHIKELVLQDDELAVIKQLTANELSRLGMSLSRSQATKLIAIENGYFIKHEHVDALNSYLDKGALYKNKHPEVSATTLLPKELVGLALSIEMGASVPDILALIKPPVVAPASLAAAATPPPHNNFLAASSNPHALFAVPKPAQKEQKDDEKQQYSPQ